MIINLIEFLKARPTLVRHGGYGIVAAIAIWSLIVIDRHHDVHSWLEKIPLFWSLFAIVSALALVIVAQAWGKTGIETSEDYYDR